MRIDGAVGTKAMETFMICNDADGEKPPSAGYEDAIIGSGKNAVGCLFGMPVTAR